jgi:hypothetical protein
MARELAEGARKLKPGIKVNIHAVPWKKTDFGGAIKTIAGQDLAALASIAEYISPMCYHHMLLREPGWIHGVVEETASQTHGRILPSIQVGEAYIEARLSALEFKAALAEALKPPSQGVVFWSWDALAKDAEKRAIVRDLLK